VGERAVCSIVRIAACVVKGSHGVFATPRALVSTRCRNLFKTLQHQQRGVRVVSGGETLRNMDSTVILL
jgi:hypothetical protein